MWRGLHFGMTVHECLRHRSIVLLEHKMSDFPNFTSISRQLGSYLIFEALEKSVVSPGHAISLDHGSVAMPPRDRNMTGRSPQLFIAS